MRLVRDNTRRADLATRLKALEQLVELGEGRLDDQRVEDTKSVLSRISQRLDLSRDHVVVAFCGASGSGKSSLFNVLAGIDLSPVSVRRPTTVTSVSCVWDPAGLEAAKPLLERIGVSPRHQLVRRSALDAALEDDLSGLVLLDLPDYDSAVRNHRAEVDRVVELVDAMVWVTDPQKYADAVWHERYLRGLSHHAEVQVVLLNQADTLAQEDVVICAEDLSRLLAADGLSEVEVIPTSARTGGGLGRLRSLLVDLVASRRVIMERLAADVDRIAEQLADDCLGGGSDSAASQPGPLSDGARDRFVEALARAAGLGGLVENVTNAYLRRARTITRGPIALVRQALRGGAREVLRLPRLMSAAEEPVPAPLQRTVAEAAVTDLVTEAVRDMPAPWAASVRAIAGRATDPLVATLDATLANTTVTPEVPAWWTLAQVGQWVTTLVGLVGLAWLIVWAAFLRRSRLSTWWGVPLPGWVFVGAVALGAVLWVVSWLVARRGAAAVRRTVSERMRERIDHAARRLVLEPIAQEVERYLQTREQFLLARHR